MSNTFILFLFIGISVWGCSSTPVKVTQTNNIDYVDISARFEAFWNKAKSKPLYQRLELWDEIVEGKFAPLYSKLIWTDPAGALSKKIDLWAAFELYEIHGQRIIQNSSLIESEVDKARERYIREYPDSIIYGSIYVMPLGPRRSSGSMLTSDSQGKAKNLMLINSDTITLAPEQMQNILIHKFTHFDYLSNPNITVESIEGKISFSRLLLISGLGEFNIAKLVNKKTLYNQNPAIIKIHEKMKEELETFNIQVFDLPAMTNYACERDFHARHNVKNFDCTIIPKVSFEFIKLLRKEYSYRKILNFSEEEIYNHSLRFFKTSKQYKDLEGIAKLSKI